MRRVGGKAYVDPHTAVVLMETSQDIKIRAETDAKYVKRLSKELAKVGLEIIPIREVQRVPHEFQARSDPKKSTVCVRCNFPREDEVHQQ